MGWRLGLQAVTGLVSISFFMGLLYRPASLYHPQRRAILHLKNQRKKVIYDTLFFFPEEKMRTFSFLLFCFIFTSESMLYTFLVSEWFKIVCIMDMVLWNGYGSIFFYFHSLKSLTLFLCFDCNQVRDINSKNKNMQTILRKRARKFKLKSTCIK